MIIGLAFVLSESVHGVEIIWMTIDEEHKCATLCKMGIPSKGKKFWVSPLSIPQSCHALLKHPE